MPTPRMLLRMLTSRELAGWKAYYTVKDEYRADEERRVRLEAEAQKMAHQAARAR